VRRLVGEGKQVIVFREQRSEARSVARYLVDELGLPPATDALAALPDGDPSRASTDLRTVLAGGVAFHVSDLDRVERQVVEEQFRRPDAAIRVVVATTTLAMGINTPAEAVVIVGLEHPGPDGGPYAVAEYKNMVGRAGRLGFASEGFAYLIATTPHEAQHYWDTYIQGVPEDVESRFLTGNADARSLVVRVLAALSDATRDAPGMMRADIVAFIADSFGAFRARQHGQEPFPAGTLERALDELQRGRLVEADGDQRYTLTRLGRLAGESGVHVDSVLRVATALGECQPVDLSDPSLIAVTQATVELDDVRFPLNRKSTQKEPAAWAAELRRQGVAGPVLRVLQRAAGDQHVPTLRAKKAVSCLFWVTDTPLATIEQTMTQFGGAFGGAAGEIRAVAQRTVDLLPIVTRIAELLHPGLDLAARRALLVSRLELGIPSPLVELATAARGGLARPELLELMRAGRSAPEDVLAADDETLLRCVGNARRVELLRAAATNAIDARNDIPLAIGAPDYQG
jgi:replicative superfamily II helicase